MIRLYILGSTSCRTATGEDLETVLRSPKRLALLTYLAVARPPGFHRRDTLLGLLWPESDQERARAALRQLLRTLRQDLGDVVLSRGAGELGLDWDRFWCDAAAFEEALDERRVGEAAELYRGELLAGLQLAEAPEFQRWLGEERTRLRRRGGEATWKLAETTEDPDLAVRAARRAASYTPQSESAARRLMAFLDDHGDRVGALREFERFSARARADLDIEPGPETRALAAEIRGRVKEADRIHDAAAGSGEEPAEPRAEASKGRAETSDSPENRRKLREGIRIGVGATLLIGLMLGLILLGIREPEGVRFRSVSRLTYEEGLEIDPVLSPDGDRIAYSAGSPFRMDIHVRRLSGGRRVSLTADLPGTHQFPDWAPDGEQIAFVTFDETAASTLQLVPALGGEVRSLYHSADSQLPLQHPTWSPDGTRIAFAVERSILTVEPESGTTALLAAGIWLPHSLAWSPAGDRIAFVSENPGYSGAFGIGNIAPSAIWVASVDGGEVTQVISRTGVNQSPVWSPDGRRLMFVSDRDGARDIYSVELDPDSKPLGSPTRLSAGLDLLTFALAPDGSRLVYSRPRITANIRFIDLARDSPVSFSAGQRLTSGYQSIETLRLSPDGRWIAYDSNASGNQDIYRIPVGGGEPIRLTRDPADDFAPVWSPDGREIAYYSFRGGDRDLYMMDSDGRRHEQLTSGDASDSFSDWSPDGRSLVFQHNPAGSTIDMPVLHQLTREGLGHPWSRSGSLTDEWSVVPRWSPDGLSIAYAGPQRVAILSLASGERRTVLEGVQRSGPVIWSPDGRELYVYKRQGSDSGLWAIPIGGGDSRLLIPETEPPISGPWFDGDGTRFYFTRREVEEADVWVAELEGQP